MDVVTFAQDSMIIDKQFVIIRDKAVYVPYLPRHTEKYHGWMTDPLIRAQTASEPLSMEEEYAMQVRWSLDADKRTFIIVPRARLHAILASQVQAGGPLGEACNSECNLLHEHAMLLPTQEAFTLSASLVHDHSTSNSAAPCARCGCPGRTSPLVEATLSLCAMCEAFLAVGPAGLTAAAGDVNLFLHHYLADEDEGNSAHVDVLNAEIEVMVAEHACRRGGVGRDAVEMIMRHGREEVGVGRYVVKISDDNIPSLSLFASLGFTEFARVECFNEVHMHWMDPQPPSYNRALWRTRFGLPEDDEDEAEDVWEDEVLKGIVLCGATAREWTGEAAARDVAGHTDVACAWRGEVWVRGKSLPISVGSSGVGDAAPASEALLELTLPASVAECVAAAVVPWRVEQLWQGKAVDKALALLHAAEDAAALSRSSSTCTLTQLLPVTDADTTHVSIAACTSAVSGFLSANMTFTPSDGGTGKVTILRKRVGGLVRSVVEEVVGDVQALLLATLGAPAAD